MVDRSVSRFVIWSTTVAVLALPVMMSAQAALPEVAVSPKRETPVIRTTITLRMDRVPLKQALSAIAEQAGLTPVYGPMVSNSSAHVTLRVNKVNVSDAFEQALRGTGLVAVIGAGDVLFTRKVESGSTVALQGGITGTVMDAKTKQPVAGATVSVSGIATSMTTSESGAFRFANVAPGRYTVRIRHLGHRNVTRDVTVVDGQTVSVDVLLEPSAFALDQVIVTGTVIPVEQRTVPVPVTVITAQQIQESGVTSIPGLLQGQVPGVVAIDYGMGADNTNNGVPITVRGDATLGFEYDNRIKIYIDGIEVADPGQINSIDPAMIERIEILRGPQASTIYGSGSISGVMQIFMKKGTTSSRPQVLVQLAVGTVENNLSSGVTVRQDHSLQVTGNTNAFSYNVGGSYKYTGEYVKDFWWKNESIFGGLQTQQGPVTASTLARFNRRPVGMGGVASIQEAQLTGQIRYSIFDMARAAQQILTTQSTIGIEAQARTFSWWQHTMRLGRDESDAGFRSDGGRFWNPGDSLQFINENPSSLTSFAYTTTLSPTLPGPLSGSLTLGYDHWQSTYESIFAQGTSLEGSISGGFTSLSRSKSRNDGYFAQALLGISDALFFTAGLRAEENPNFGEDVHFAYSPRVGVAYTRELGDVTMKLRTSYGQSTRPPSASAKARIVYNPQNIQLANPDVGPENQHGTDGGVELYFGQRASLNLTYYNQYVTDVLRSILVQTDTAGSIITTYRQWMNVGNVHNTGAELEGMLITGPLTTRATYSLVNSKIGKLIPEAADLGLVAGQRLPGVAPHTGALSLTYSEGRTRGTFEMTYVAVTPSQGDAGYNRARFDRLAPNLTATYADFIGTRPAQTRANVSAAQTVTSHLEVYGRVDNVGNQNTNASEFPVYPSIGRQFTIGVRLR